MYNINKKAMLFGLMLGDGWISVINNEKYHHHASGFSGDKESLEIVKTDLIELFGDIGKAKINTRKTYSPKYNINGITSSFAVNTKISKEFISLGMPIGKRTEQEFLLPEWITKGNKNIKISFLSGLYSAEGYTPAMQKNDKTLKPLGLNISKREIYSNNLYQFIEQITTICNELEIDYTVNFINTVTCDNNIKAIISFNNNLKNIINVLNLLDLRYCREKQKEFDTVKAYYNLKKETLKRLEKAYEEVLKQELTVKQISEKYNILIRQIYGWKKRKTGFRIPNDFLNYTKFKQTYCSL